MKGTANKIFWTLLEDCKKNYNSKYRKGCPGCRMANIENENMGCSTCIFWNVAPMKEHCTREGRKILKKMRDV